MSESEAVFIVLVFVWAVYASVSLDSHRARLRKLEGGRNQPERVKSDPLESDWRNEAAGVLTSGAPVAALERWGHETTD